MYWRHVVASSLAETKAAADEKVIERGAMLVERPGSDRYQQTHMAMIFQDGLSFSGFERNKVFIGGAGMKYLDISDISGADSEGDCRGVVVADYDDDGDPDLFVNAIQREQHMLYRNDAGDANPGGFVKVRLRASSGHPDAIGATVKLRFAADSSLANKVQAQVLACGGGFESQSAPELIFGLGKAAGGELVVHWPGRAVESFGKVGRGTRWRLVEGTGKPQPIEARPFRFADPRPRGIRVERGDQLTSLRLGDLEGGATKDVKLAGEKPVLVNFWATTCASCVRELPLLDRLDREGKYRVVAVSLDPASRRASVETLRTKLGLQLEVYVISSAEAGKLFDLSRLGIPASLVLSPEGRIERILQGQLPVGDL